LISVLPAIELDDQCALETDKIDDEITDRFLATEPEVVDLTAIELSL